MMNKEKLMSIIQNTTEHFVQDKDKKLNLMMDYHTKMNNKMKQ